jgi:hypothetical protein
MHREVALDSWRGLMLVVMAVVHLGGRPAAFFGEILGFASAAEGFVFLSGVMCGLVYGRYGTVSAALMRTRTWGRARTIYVYHVATLAFLLVAITAMKMLPGGLAAYYEKTNLALLVDAPLRGLLAILTLALQPVHFDILPLYVLYMALAPLFLYLFERGHSAAVCAASAALWLFAQLGASQMVIALVPANGGLRWGNFDPFAWQILFVAGSYLGWRRACGLALLPRIPAGVYAAAWVAAVLLFALRHGLGDAALASYVDLEWAVSKLRVGWLRLLNDALIAFIVYQVACRHGVELRNAWLALLGGHSLQVYAFHAAALYLLLPLRWRVAAYGEWADLLFGVAFLASMTLPAILHRSYRGTVRIRAAAAQHRA